MVGNVGAVRNYSSRDLASALNVLNAVGGNKDKIKILEEIKKAQDEYERLLNESRAAKKEAEQAQARAQETIDKAVKSEAQAKTAQDNLRRDTDAAARRIEGQEHSLAIVKAELDARIAAFKTDVAREKDAIAKEKEAISLQVADIQHRENECAALEKALQKRRDEFAQIENFMKKILNGQ
jgi:chromosome segregation ATPase